MLAHNAKLTSFPPALAVPYRAAIIICKLDFKYTRREKFHDRPNLSTGQFAFRQIFCERNNIK
jgi:hypothetical protein